MRYTLPEKAKRLAIARPASGIQTSGGGSVTSMAISDEDIQKVREASDLVAIMGETGPVKQRGRDFWLCCPFHNEKTPSCKIDPALQLWHCFGCGEGGDVFAFIMKSQDLSFPEAVRYLAERAHIDIADDQAKRGPGMGQGAKARLRAVCAEAAEFFHTQLMRSKSPQAGAARAYLSQRGLGGDIPKTWMLGFAPGQGALVRHLASKGFESTEMIQANVAVVGSDGRVRDRFFNRVMFPIKDEQGQCIAFGGRVIGKGEPKYLNSQETPLFHKGRMLYALDKAKAAMASTGVAVVSEGYTDVIAMHEAGIRNAVATLGTALTRTHIRVLSRHARKRIVYLFDGDAAGQRAADRALQFIDSSMTPEAGAARIDLFAVTLPDNLDPAEFIAAHGGRELQALIDQAKPLLEYGIDRRLGNWDLSRAEGRSAAVADALSVLAPIKDSLLAKDYARQIASRARADENDVLGQLANLKPPRIFDAEETAGGHAGNAAPAAPVRRKLPQSEMNRRRFERQLLALCAARTDLALAHADALASVQWHDPACAAVSASMLDTLTADPAALPAAIVGAASMAEPRAAGFLTRGVPESAVPEDLAAFLVEELSIGDTEEAISAMRAQMSAPASMPPEDYELLFETVAAMQRELTARKRAHSESATSSR